MGHIMILNTSISMTDYNNDLDGTIYYKVIYDEYPVISLRHEWYPIPPHNVKIIFSTDSQSELINEFPEVMI